MMIGVSPVAEGLHFVIPKGYIYFSMAFAFLVDVIQMRTLHPKTATQKAKAVESPKKDGGSRNTAKKTKQMQSSSN